MKKIIISLAILLIGAGVFALPKKNDLEILPLLNSESSSPNRVWVGTFQIVWNDFMDEVVKGPVKFVKYESPMAEGLNKQKFKVDQLSEDSYYKTYGLISPELRKQIEQGIKNKFNETSDILGMFNWKPAENKYLVYAMLKKNFKFTNAFDKLEPSTFGKNKEKVKYFGINKNSKEELKDSVIVLFYNSKKDYAVSIRTQGPDTLYLYKTNDDKTFDKLYSEMFMKHAKYDGAFKMTAKDELKVPDVDFFKLKEFQELCNHMIVGKDFMIEKAIETVEFKLNNEGVELKSEAAIANLKSTWRPLEPNVKPKYFYFDNTFVIFLQESGKSKPYFAARIDDVAFVNKQQKK